MLKSQVRSHKSPPKAGPPLAEEVTRFHISKHLICYLLFVILSSGCAAVIEGTKGAAGISTKALEDGRKEAITRAFNSDYASCYNKSKKVLVNFGAYIYAQSKKKKMLAIYVSKEDTTPVGIFFKEIDADNTQIEVSSPSTYARELISEKLFLALEEIFKKKGQL